MTDGSQVDDEMVAVLARAADLPLAEDRRAVVREVLGAWLLDANELSRKMSEPEHWTVTPATVFTHPTPGEDL